jgi:hypothetical protein
MDWPNRWWSFDAIEEADKLFSGKKIFEFGSGGSTVRNAKIASQIVSVENDYQWLEKVRKKNNRKPKNSTNSILKIQLDLKTLLI